MNVNWNAAGQPITGEIHVTTAGDDESPLRDERIALPMDGETALRALLQVDAQSEPPDEVTARLKKEKDTR